MNPLQLLLIGGAAFLAYQMFFAPAEAAPVGTAPSGEPTGPNGAPVVTAPKPQAQQQKTINMADLLKATAGQNALNFHQWNWYAQRLYGGVGYAPEDFGVDGSVAISAEQYVSILGGSWPGTPRTGMAGLGAGGSRYITMEDTLRPNVVTGAGPTAWEAAVAKGYRRIN